MNLTVSCVTAFDSTSGLYTYTYTVNSSAQSGSAMEVFGIYPMKYQVSIAAPAHWAAFDKYQEKKDAVVWRVYDNVGSHTADSTSYYEVPQSPYCLAPGQNLSGFVLMSRQPPGTVTWYAQGYDTMASVDADETEGIRPNASSLFQLNVSGTTVWPDLQSPVGVEAAEGGLELAFGGGALNPATGEIQIWYHLPKSERVNLAVYDVQGRRIALLADGVRAAGRHTVAWNGRTARKVRVASGTYFARLTLRSGQSRVARLMLVR